MASKIGLEQMIPVINKLQDVFNVVGASTIDLPQIVVIGSQSSGKSSVLESIVGRDFLPRGSGIVTRRPLVLQLHRLTDEDFEDDDTTDDKEKEWGEFLHLPGEKIYDFDEIRNEIIRETDRVAGKGKSIHNNAIRLSVYSKNVLNLTLVDLPGITKVPVYDQPEDIEKIIRDMCIDFVKNPNSIILAVSAANNDLANSEAIKMARSVDPSGNRTLGVITKLDLMDKGTDATEMLSGKVINLKKGFVGVVNRSQADINANMSIKESLRKEVMFFKRHNSYKGLAGKMGISYLSKIMNQMLMGHIRDTLPSIRRRISSMVIENKTELDELGDEVVFDNLHSQGGLLLNLITSFSNNFAQLLEGKAPKEDTPTDELYGGARIGYIFNEIFTKGILDLNPFEDLSDEDIRTSIRNANGARPSLFVPEGSFEILVRRQIASLEQLGLQCVDFVYDELNRITSMCETPEILRFGELRDQIVDVVHALTRSRLNVTMTMISNLIEVELAHVNTNHPDFIGGSRAVAAVMEKISREQEEAEANAGHGSRTPPPIPGGSNNNNSSNKDDVKKGSFLGFMFGSKKEEESSPKLERSGTTLTLPRVPDTVRAHSTVTEREVVEVSIIKSLISSYFAIVQKNFLDLVPKTIMCFIVNHMKSNMQTELVKHLYNEDNFKSLLAEDEHVAMRRNQCVELDEALRKAMKIVNEVRDFNIR